MFRTALRFAAGAAIALALWIYATPSYNALICSVLRAAGVQAEPAGVAIRVTRVDAPSIQVPADQLTYNIILFAGLMAAAPPRRLWRGLAAFAVLVIFHGLAIATTIEATYATRAGAWSNAHYSPAAQDFWNSIAFIYRLGGMFAIAFVCWYAATWSGARESRSETSRTSARGEQKRRRAAASRR